MITKENLPGLLDVLGFEKRRQKFSKFIGITKLEIDFSKEEIIYPNDLKYNERQTLNFSMPENFVVFECVHRLLTKGYQSRHIELETKWPLGHGASGGRGDILVRDNDEKPLLIIECKTAGREFERAWRRTMQDGGQLFSYVHQINETQFLCLYTSHFADGVVHYQSNVISHLDNEKYLATSSHLKSFRAATSVPSRFAVWRDTYRLDFTQSGIFEDAIQPYHIGKDKYVITDLHPISAADQQKKYHEFATILRQHNVSGRENAFDKLVNLFLCKLVDETENIDDLKFYWKGVAYDTHFELLDRLQQLYQKGMGKFLDEDITYINESDISNALRFVRRNPDATQNAVWRLFIRQKFFTNNDFSFIDVHNEKLFYQNAEVLLKILQMWQSIKLIGDHRHNQFLGDMFEGFLDQGVKQSEGQYFTPGPICRFLLMSLPLEALVKAQLTPPKAIDYACGAGHFLTEMAQQLKPIIERYHPLKSLAEYHSAIYGIEKEYRLSKIAKVSAFMYGQPNINICYGDALLSAHDTFPEIRNGTFDLLVANPPFSVRGFLETLPEIERNAYLLAETIDKLDSANAIETFFLERAKQLLRTGGLAAIILPSSVLSNGGNTYIRAREILLHGFDLVAIAEFGSGTFGKTGTNTVALFLRRKATAPDAAEHYHERVNEWFKGAESHKRRQVIYRDADLIDRYATHRGIPPEDYKTLLCGTPSATLLDHEVFSAYHRAFDASAEVKSLRMQRKFRTMTTVKQDEEMGKRFLAFAQAIERDKLLHFVLADRQPNSVLILKGSTETKEQKKFLGYEWSSAKGGEGIKLTKDAQGRHVTPLYDEENRHNPTKLNHAIAQNFAGMLKVIPAGLEAYLSLVPLTNLLDFSRINFDKQIALSVKNYRDTFAQSKWSMKLGAICSLEYGKPLPESTRIPGSFPVMGSNGRVGFHNEYLIEGPAIIIGRKGSMGEVTWESLNCFPIDTSFYVKLLSSGIRLRFMYEQLKLLDLDKIGGGMGVPGLNRHDAYEAMISLPPIEIQDQIVAQCEAVDAETDAAQSSIERARRTVESAVNEIYASNASRIAINSVSLSVQYGLSEAMNEDRKGYKIFRMNEIEHGHMVDGGRMKYADISAKDFTIYRLKRGDVLFNRTNSIEHIGKTGLFNLDGEYCFASYLVRLVPDKRKILPLFLTMMMNSIEFQSEAKRKASKSINQANINATIMRNIHIPVPSLLEQERYVTIVRDLESQIHIDKAIVVAAPARKKLILQSYI